MNEPKSQSIDSNKYQVRETGKSPCVYRACVPLLCSQCGRTIQSGKIFTRSADKKGLVSAIRYIQCRNCVVIDLVDEDF